MSQAPPTRRRWYQFGIGTMFVVMTGICICLALCVSSAEKQRRAVDSVGKQGHVVYYHEFPTPYGSVGSVNYQADPPGPRWLRNIIGDDYFRTVRHVSFTPDESSLAQLRNLPSVEELAIDAYRLKDQDLHHLAGLTHLKSIVVQRGYALTDACLVHLKSISSLERVSLRDMPITDAGTTHLKEMTGLKQLSFKDTLLSPDAVADLRATLPSASIQLWGSYQPKKTVPHPIYAKNEKVTRERRQPTSK